MCVCVYLGGRVEGGGGGVTCLTADCACCRCASCLKGGWVLGGGGYIVQIDLCAMHTHVNTHTRTHTRMHAYILMHPKMRVLCRSTLYFVALNIPDIAAAAAAAAAAAKAASTTPPAEKGEKGGHRRSTAGGHKASKKDAAPPPPVQRMAVVHAGARGVCLMTCWWPAVVGLFRRCCSQEGRRGASACAPVRLCACAAHACGACRCAEGGACFCLRVPFELIPWRSTSRCRRGSWWALWAALGGHLPTINSSHPLLLNLNPYSYPRSRIPGL